MFDVDEYKSNRFRYCRDCKGVMYYRYDWILPQYYCKNCDKSEDE